MSWFRIDDDWSDSAKVDVMSDAAIRLWSICGTWCCKKRNLHLDGFVPRAALATITKRRWTDEVLEGLIRELVEVSKLGGLHERGLWEPREGGWRFHDWDRYKPKDSDEPLMTPSEAGSLGGRKSAESRRAANGTAQPQKLRSNSEATPKQLESFEGASTEAPHRSTLEALAAPDPDPDPDPVPDPEGETRAPVSRKISTGARRFAASFETTAPDSLEFTAEHREFQGQLGIVLEQVWLECRDYRRARKETREDWAAEFLSWLRKEVRIRRERGNRANQRGAKAPKQSNSVGGFGDQVLASLEKGR